ncbi:uncharacterized protein CLUP02_03222 [Colletotrichum lupini]|uniref:Uncharacterized protein n=1 Tax=Colletotrichum lupini TaxID=145971 RepID=A0A9Q8WC51_9PEZI|nr:uncharacterized protein CLUP02_03222 [Colletotrichum lupini]UQC77751.1 hypothetical protein CLUP02_03222 [Colletotrichum lupini]
MVGNRIAPKTYPTSPNDTHTIKFWWSEGCSVKQESTGPRMSTARASAREPWVLKPEQPFRQPAPGSDQKHRPPRDLMRPA